MQEASAREVRIIRAVIRSVGGLVAVAVLLYPADWAVWRIRVALGGGMGTVQVERFTVAELKGHKQEYYPEGSAAAECSHSLFPQGGNKACWWLRRNPTVIKRY